MKVVCLVFAVHFVSSFVNSVEIKEFKSDGKLNQGSVKSRARYTPSQIYS